MVVSRFGLPRAQRIRVGRRGTFLGTALWLPRLRYLVFGEELRRKRSVGRVVSTGVRPAGGSPACVDWSRSSAEFRKATRLRRGCIAVRVAKGVADQGGSSGNVLGTALWLPRLRYLVFSEELRRKRSVGRVVSTGVRPAGGSPACVDWSRASAEFRKATRLRRGCVAVRVAKGAADQRGSSGNVLGTALWLPRLRYLVFGEELRRKRSVGRVVSTGVRPAGGSPACVDWSRASAEFRKATRLRRGCIAVRVAKGAADQRVVGERSRDCPVVTTASLSGFRRGASARLPAWSSRSLGVLVGRVPSAG